MNFIENFHGRTTFISNSVISELLRAQSIVIRIKTIKANPKTSIIIDAPPNNVLFVKNNKMY